MSSKFLLASAATCMLACGCASPGASTPTSTTTANSASSKGSSSAPAAAASDDYGPVQKVKSRDGSFEGEVVGAIVPGGKFSKLQIGMLMPEVLKLVGGPDGMATHETGKRWIPFYFGGDARRVEVFYKGEGCLTYTGGNRFGGGDNELIRITATQRTDCTE